MKLNDYGISEYATNPDPLDALVGKHAPPQKDLLSYLTTKTAAFSSPKSESPVAVVVWGLAKGDTEIYGLLRRLPHSALPLPRPLSPRNPERAKTSP